LRWRFGERRYTAEVHTQEAEATVDHEKRRKRRKTTLQDTHELQQGKLQKNCREGDGQGAGKE